MALTMHLCRVVLSPDPLSIHGGGYGMYHDHKVSFIGMGREAVGIWSTTKIFFSQPTEVSRKSIACLGSGVGVSFFPLPCVWASSVRDSIENEGKWVSG